MKHPAWCLIDTNNQRFRCVRCGETMPLPLPMPVDAACKLAEAFSLMHRDCKDQPKPAQEATTTP